GHRRGDAAHGRPRSRRPPAGGAAEDESALHVRIYGSRDDAARFDTWHRVSAEALHARGVRAEGAHGAGSPAGFRLSRSGTIRARLGVTQVSDTRLILPRMPDSPSSLSPPSQTVPANRRRLPIGAEPAGDGRTHVRVWAPRARRVHVVCRETATALAAEA